MMVGCGARSGEELLPCPHLAPAEKAVLRMRQETPANWSMRSRAGMLQFWEVSLCEASYKLAGNNNLHLQELMVKVKSVPGFKEFVPVSSGSRPHSF